MSRRGVDGQPSPQATYTANNTTSDSTDGFRTTTGWTTILKAAYDAGNTPVGDHTNTADNFRRTTSATWSPITLVDYDTGNTPTGNHTSTADGFRRTSTGSTWSTFTKAEYDGQEHHRRQQRRIPPHQPVRCVDSDLGGQYNARNVTSDGTDGVQIGGDEFSPPYTAYKPGAIVSTPNDVILARFITGADTGIEWSGILGDNETEANMFLRPTGPRVPAALKAVALGECGATLTLQTKVGSAYAADPFIYQNRGSTSYDRVIDRTSRPPRWTFDFTIPSGTSRTVVITPSNLSNLTQLHLRVVDVQGGQRRAAGHEQPRSPRSQVSNSLTGERGRQRGRVVCQRSDDELT